MQLYQLKENDLFKFYHTHLNSCSCVKDANFHIYVINPHLYSSLYSSFYCYYCKDSYISLNSLQVILVDYIWL